MPFLKDFLKNGYQSTDTVYETIACYGSVLDFNIYGFDPDTPNATTQGYEEKFIMQVLNGLPGSTITVHNETFFLSSFRNIRLTTSTSQFQHG